MTVREAIGFVDEIFPNTFSNETKTRWLSQCDAAIWNDVMLLPAYSFPGYRWMYDSDRPLIVPEAYEQLYVYWLSAQMHKAYAELPEYENDAQLYNSLYKRFVIWYADTFDPAHGGVMPLPPITTFRRGETATIILPWIFPYKPEDVASLSVTMTNESDMTVYAFDPTRFNAFSGYMSYDMTHEETLALTPGVYSFHAIGQTSAATGGRHFENHVTPLKLVVMDTTYVEETNNGE